MEGWIAAAAFVTAVVVAWLGFRYSIRQDERRWTRERRAELYIDLLVAESAEHDWVLHRATEQEAGVQLDRAGTDDRMSSAERRRLGARAAAFASAEVLRRWNALQHEGGQVFVPWSAPTLVRVHVSAGLDSLTAQVRHELAVERLPWWQRVRTPGNSKDELGDLLKREAVYRAKVANAQQEAPSDEAAP